MTSLDLHPAVSSAQRLACGPEFLVNPRGHYPLPLAEKEQDKLTLESVATGREEIKKKYQALPLHEF